MNLIRRMIKVSVLSLLVMTIFTTINHPALAEPISLSNSELEVQILKVIHKHPEVILESIEEYRKSQQKQEQEVKLKLLQAIKIDPKNTIDKSPVKGVIGSRIILIEFSDFQCPYCVEAQKTLHQFVLNHQDKVTLVYKHYPISQIHSEAMPAAIASWAAHQQNRFWQYHDFLFAHQEQLGEKFYLQVAKDLGLNLTQFERDRKSQAAIIAIQKDMQLAEKLGISGTPFFVMNEETFSGAVQKSFLEDKLVNAS
jgi:protein-disulfide isomerase